jgi:hypothetical protein
MSELRASLRHLRRHPAHAAIIVLSLGIGIAVCIAVFSLINVLAFASIPGISDRTTLIRTAWSNQRGLLTADEFQSLEEQATTAFTSVAGQGDHPMAVVLPSGPATVPAAGAAADAGGARHRRLDLQHRAGLARLACRSARSLTRRIDRLPDTNAPRPLL